MGTVSFANHVRSDRLPYTAPPSTIGGRDRAQSRNSNCTFHSLTDSRPLPLLSLVLPHPCGRLCAAVAMCWCIHAHFQCVAPNAGTTLTAGHTHNTYNNISDTLTHTQAGGRTTAQQGDFTHDHM